MTILERVRTKPGYKVLAAVAVILAAYHYAGKEAVKIPRMTYADIRSIQEQKLAERFAAKGSPEPAAMAKASMATKRPHLVAAQAIVESNGNTKARGKAGERGAWQVIERYHGHAGNTALQQALKHERIMDDLLRETNGDVKKSVRMYNGSLTNKATERYLTKVTHEALQIALSMP